MALEPASLSVSTSPMRTRVENSEPSRTTDSAAVAPAFMAAATTSVAVSFRFIFLLGHGGFAAGCRKSFLAIGDGGFGGCGVFPSHHLRLLTLEFLIDLEKMFDGMQHVWIDLFHLVNVV